MTGFDCALLATIALSVLIAAAEGFFFEMFFLAGSVAGYLLAAWEYPRAAAWFREYVAASWVANAAGFVTIFFGVIFVAGVAGRIARWIFKTAGLQWVDRVLGAAFGLVRGLLFASVIVMTLVAFSPGVNMVAQSRLGHYFLVLVHGVSWMAPAELRAKLRQGTDKATAAALRGEAQADSAKPAH